MGKFAPTAFLRLAHAVVEAKFFSSLSQAQVATEQRSRIAVEDICLRNSLARPIAQESRLRAPLNSKAKVPSFRAARRASLVANAILDYPLACFGEVCTLFVYTSPCDNAYSQI